MEYIVYICIGTQAELLVEHENEDFREYLAFVSWEDTV